MTNNAMAIQYLPDLEFNQSGSAVYTTDGKLVISAEPTSIIFEGVNKIFIDPPEDVKFYAEYVSGGYSSPWYFTGDSIVAPDITITGVLVTSTPPSGFPSPPTGTLITGNITGMKYQDIPDVQLGLITGYFNITPGCDLYSYYASTGYKGMYSILLEFYDGIEPTDPGYGWNASGAKGDISPTPEPASMLLFGLGLLGFGSGVIRKRFKA